ncbi:MAG: SLC13 family permease [Dehalococcoidales bacterium]|nr:MAG: SLC13 family permease [Dehalococcoidales bacterium]
MDNLDLILTVLVLLGAFGLFISGKVRVDLVAVCVLVALLVLGLVTPEEGLRGFANPATVTIGAMFIVGMGLVRTGLVQRAATIIDRLAGKGETRLIFILCIITAALSAFLVNTAAVAILIPVVITLTAKRKISSSRVLIPLSFSSQFGGVCTIIGTSTNMLVNGISIGRGMESFSFFEFAPLGLVMVAAGIVYLLITSRWLLPKRKGETDQVDKYRLADYQAEFQVQGDSILIGKTWEENKIPKESGVELTNLLREGKAVSRPVKTKIRPGDLLLLNSHIENLIEMENTYSLEMLLNARSVDDERQHEVRLVEVLIPPNSNLIGYTIQDSSFFRRYQHPVLAIQRRGTTLKERLADIKLESGDTLLVHGHEDDIQRLMNSPNVIVTNEVTELNIRKNKSTMAVIVMLAVIVLAVTGVVSIMVAAIIGALGMIVTRCITIEEAYNAIDWKIIFLLGGIIPLGIAMESNGVVQALADGVLQPLISFGPVAVLAVIYIVVAFLTEGMSNNAVAAIMAPIAFTLAGIMGVDPRPFLVAITFAASTSFATPIGYQTNTMVYSAGGYKFTDFAKIGIPLNLIYWALAILLIPVIWPFNG